MELFVNEINVNNKRLEVYLLNENIPTNKASLLKYIAKCFINEFEKENEYSAVDYIYFLFKILKKHVLFNDMIDHEYQINNDLIPYLRDFSSFVGLFEQNVNNFYEESLYNLNTKTMLIDQSLIALNKIKSFNFDFNFDFTEELKARKKYILKEHMLKEYILKQYEAARIEKETEIIKERQKEEQIEKQKEVQKEIQNKKNNFKLNFFNNFINIKNNEDADLFIKNNKVLFSDKNFLKKFLIDICEYYKNNKSNINKQHFKILGLIYKNDLDAFKESLFKGYDLFLEDYFVKNNLFNNINYKNITVTKNNQEKFIEFISNDFKTINFKYLLSIAEAPFFLFFKKK